MVKGGSSYFAHGKLMLIGEFFVLRGANSVAAPSFYGQTMNLESHSNSKELLWEANLHDSLWFNARYRLKDFEVLESSNPYLAESFARLIRVTRELNPSFLKRGAKVVTKLTYPQSWGLGSSSTIIKILGDWANVDPFKIHFATSQGSGYDIASAIAQKPIVYSCENETPSFCEVELPAVVKESCYFIHLGKKQNSQKSVKLFMQRVTQSLPIESMNSLVSSFLKATSVDDLCLIIREHDEMLSPILDLERVKKVAFRDFDGEIKSLGAWGGDFVMACTPNGFEYVKSYFERKGLDAIFSYSDLLL